MKRHYIFLIPLLWSALFLTSCSREEPDQSARNDTEKLTKHYVNMFAFNMMSTYYLWNQEISAALKTWPADADPVAKVREVRYKDIKGTDIDRWTQAFDDYSTFVNDINGISSTYGADFVLYYTDSSRQKVCAVITYVYKDSPADKAGLKRGDAIFAVNGKVMTTSDYAGILGRDYYGSSSVTVTLRDGSTVSMNSVTMYEDPVLQYSIFDCAGKKVGYLVYTSFTRDSCLRLLEACRYFKDEGIKELILDLRYNGGGQTTVEAALASMLAPEANVKAGDIYEIDIYNKELTEMMGDGTTRFKTDFKLSAGGDEVSFSTDGLNLGLSRLYALTGPGTASASESLITGLRPYYNENLEIIGAQTYGKYCAGIIYPASSWFRDVKDQLTAEEYADGLKYGKDWGIYVMISRFADKYGTTPCMPDGFTPDYPADDNPANGLPLGDPQEPLLKVALQHAGFEYPAGPAGQRAAADAFRPYGPLPPELVDPRIGRFNGKFEIVGKIGEKVKVEELLQFVD